MKNLLFAILLFVSLFSFSQPIIINRTNYSVDQLVNQVLINSPCVSGLNVMSKNGNQFGSTNSIGYFENQNLNFPFASGVVLSTGAVERTSGPNISILSDGNAAWTGDSDLESNLLSQSGISIQSINASYIEFDFIPKTPLFNFSFLFASEEYGLSQCNFSDSFAFLLKDTTIGGSYSNLAVVPLTTIPISVITIRDSQYNSNCTSENPTFFGSFNGNGFGPAINFNGQTIKMTASAAGLDITHTYHIKIVIADGRNNIGYDSAIFLEANSFNVGQNVLGLDYTIANNTAFCPNDILPTLNAAGLSPLTTFSWLNGGTPIAGQTSSSLNLELLVPRPTSGINSFSVVYIEPNCTAITDNIDVQIYPNISVMATIPSIYACSGTAPYSFDLDSNTSNIITGSGLPISTTISYFSSNANSIANTSALTSPYSTFVNQTIYVRINSTTSPCYVIKTFSLQIVPGPAVMAVPPPLSVCSSTLTGNFNLTTSINSIFGAQSRVYNVISFHSTQVGADTNTAILVPTGANLTSISRTLYVRIQNISNENCYTTTFFDLVVKPNPLVDTVPNTVVCDSFTLSVLLSVGAEYSTLTGGLGMHPVAGDLITPVGTTPSNFINMYVSNTLDGCFIQKLFKITLADISFITPSPTTTTSCNSYRLPTIPYGKYYTLPDGAGSLLPNNALISTTSTLYVRFVDTTVIPNCIIENPFTIEINIFPLLPSYDPKFYCNPYILPADINGGTYYSGPNKQLPIIAPNTLISSTTTIWVYKENTTIPVCFSEKSFVINIGPSSLNPPGNITNCSTYTLPALPIVGSEYWSAANGAGVQYFPGDLINTTTTLYYYVSGQSCTNNLPFTITITLEPLPNFLDTTPVCDVYYLPPVSHTGDYYTGSGGTGTKRLPGYAVTSTQTMYFYDRASATCFLEKSFLITINNSPLVTVKPNEVNTCNTNYILDDLANGEYYQFSGGPSALNPVLLPNYSIPLAIGATTIYVYNSNNLPAPNTCISEYSISVSLINTLVNPIADQFPCDSFTLPAIAPTGGDYYTATGGANGLGIKLLPPYIPITSDTILYLYKESAGRISCYNEDVFAINIQTTPIISPIVPKIVCDSYILPSYNSIATNGGIVSHYFTLPGGPTVSGNTEKFPTDVITSSITLYAYSEVGTATTAICFDEKPFQITINVTSILVPSEIVSSSHCATENFTLSPLTVGNYFEDLPHTIPLISSSIVATKTIYVYADTNTNPNCATSANFTVTIYDTPVFAPADIATVSVCNSYTLPVLATPNSKYFTAPNGGGIEILSGTIFTAPTQTIYVHSESGVSPVICPADSSLQINIFNVSEPLPNTTPNTFCRSYQLPIVSSGNYYTAPNGLGTPMFSGQLVTTSQTIYVYAISPSNPLCFDEYSFYLEIIYAPIAFPIPTSALNICDLDGTNDGETLFDLTTLTPFILGSQVGPQFSIQYYATYGDAFLNLSPITTNTLESFIFFSINDSSPSNSCNVINTVPIQINVNKLPEPKPINGAVCIDENGNVVRNYTLLSRLSSTNYSFVWTNSLAAIVGTNSNLTVSTPDDYTVIATNTLTGCVSEPVTATVINSQKAVVSYTVSNAFDNNQIITVIATGVGNNYEYQIDGGPFQDSPIFENQNYVLEHTIIVRDKNGCGITPLTAIVVNYPKLFTPNGDSFSDTWMVYGISQLKNANIFIYNRYGKIITQLNSKNESWDGTINNELLPADDYWFTISYTENGNSKEFKSHFSLKR